MAGSFQGKTGHADGKPSEARFNHPRGVTMDDKGNVYVADTLNLAIRKIGDSGIQQVFFIGFAYISTQTEGDWWLLVVEIYNQSEKNCVFKSLDFFCYRCYYNSWGKIKYSWV